MEDIINQIDGKVQVIFEKTTEYNQTYCDALWMTQEEYDSTSNEVIESMKQQRFDNWLAIVNAVPTEEPLIQQE